MNDDIDIIDNFLSKADYDEIYALVMNKPHPNVDPTVALGFGYTENKWNDNGVDKKDYQFHCHIKSDYLQHEKFPQFDKMFRTYFSSYGYKIMYWHRIKINILQQRKEHTIHRMHYDTPVSDREIKRNNHANQTNAILYLDDTDAPTYFADGRKVECVKNRCVVFSNSLLHASSTPMNADTRAVINFNWC